ncbi:hypothetical protein CR513_28452, partial [Mucuna pruriens]
MTINFKMLGVTLWGKSTIFQLLIASKALSSTSIAATRQCSLLGNTTRNFSEEIKSLSPKTKLMVKQIKKLEAKLGERFERMEKKNKRGLGSVRRDTQSVNTKVEALSRGREGNRKLSMRVKLVMVGVIYGEYERLETHGKDRRRREEPIRESPKRETVTRNKEQRKKKIIKWNEEKKMKLATSARKKEDNKNDIHHKPHGNLIRIGPSPFGSSLDFLKLGYLERGVDPLSIRDEFPNEQILEHPERTKKNLKVMTNITYVMILIFGDSTITKSFAGAFRIPRSSRSSNSIIQHLEAAIMDQVGQSEKS